MTTGHNPAAGPPSGSGVLRAGNRFQDLAVLIGALQLLRPASPYQQMEVEAKGVGNLDDVILRGRDGDDLYGQVKWATTPSDLLNENYLLKRVGNGTSILEKLYKGWVKVSTGKRAPTLRLITNRALDPTDPLLKNVDGRSEMLMPFADTTTPGSDASRALDRWAQHIGINRDDLLPMLTHLRWWTGRSVSSETEFARVLMDAAGLEATDAALELALAAVNGWVIDGRRDVSPAEVRRTVDALGLARRRSSAILTVQAIEIDPHADDADESVNWIQLYDGDSPRTRVIPADVASWEQMAAELDAAAARLEEQGLRSTIVRGAMRQATLFRVGAALPHIRGHKLTYRQGQQIWETSATKEDMQLHSELRAVQPGDGEDNRDLVVAVGVSIDPTDEVLAYVSEADIDAACMLTVLPSGGADDASVATAGQAVALAESIRNAVRTSASETHAQRVHLFLAGPGGLALLLGHRWNRVPTTTVYEHRGVGAGYVPAFEIIA